MIFDMRIRNGAMARPKKFSDRVVLSFPPETFGDIARLSEESEERASFIRLAVAREIALRRSGAYEDLKAQLLANETVEDFCLSAIRRAVAHRKAALADSRSDTPINP